MVKPISANRKLDLFLAHFIFRKSRQMKSQKQNHFLIKFLPHPPQLPFHPPNYPLPSLIGRGWGRVAYYISSQSRTTLHYGGALYYVAIQPILQCNFAYITLQFRLYWNTFLRVASSLCSTTQEHSIVLHCKASFSMGNPRACKSLIIKRF